MSDLVSGNPDSWLSRSKAHILLEETANVSHGWKKVQVGSDQEMAQSERNSHFTNRGIGKN